MGSISWHMLADAGLTIAGLGCVGVGVMRVLAGHKLKGGMPDLSLERSGFAFGLIGCVLIVLGAMAELV